MTVGFTTFFQKRFKVEFVVKNISKKQLKIFGYPVLPGGELDLMNIPYVSEADIKHAILKGELKVKLDANEIEINASNIDLNSYDQDFIDYLTNDLGITVGVTDNGGSGDGYIAVQDEGVEILSQARTLNFVGADVVVDSNGNIANIFIPPPNFVSHWNTSDGSNGNQSVSESISRIITRISTPAGGEGNPFSTNGWAATNQSTTLSNNVAFTTPGNTTGFGGNSTMTVTVYDANGISILDIFTTPFIISNNIFTSGSGNITVTITNFGSDSFRFQANASININIGNILTGIGREGGRYHVQITHVTDSVTDGTGPYTYVQPDVFLDSNPTTPVISGTVTIAETVG
ncbi:MAG: hypothetical protein HC877_23950, partial [Thioploca sp.]|nr:hypothetical protein [Thioploca sp.]